LKKNSTDPLSNAVLQSKAIVPNNALRSQIVSWFEQNPRAASLRNSNAIKPPPSLPADGEKICGLDMILRYKGKVELKDEKRASDDKPFLPQDFCEYGHSYQFAISPESVDNILVRCNGGPWIEAPDKAMFATPSGVVFYDPTEIRETRVLPGTEVGGAKLCKFGNGCRADECTSVHAFVCARGAACEGGGGGGKGCKFLHPSADSVTPLGREYPANKECKYKVACTNKTCGFAHPFGRMPVPRETARVWITHTLELEELAAPVPLPLDVPDVATSFQFQGEFVFFFEPYPGTWAKEHYKTAIAHRFDPARQRHRLLRDFSLDGHYCNCAVGAGGYMVFSFWPYEEEAIRAIWECLRVARSMEKELRAKTREADELRKELGGKDAEVSKLQQAIADRDAHIADSAATIAHLRASAQFKATQLARARQDARAAAEDSRRAQSARREAVAEARAARAAAAAARKEHRASEAAWRRQQQNQERARAERLRLRDPIHIYALRGGAAGARGEDWQLVLDYHKGAHDIRLGRAGPGGGGVQGLEVTEHRTVYRFELAVPADVGSIGAPLPLVPARLCPDF
jgi:hypothetical protein